MARTAGTTPTPYLPPRGLLHGKTPPPPHVEAKAKAAILAAAAPPVSERTPAPRTPAGRTPHAAKRKAQQAIQRSLAAATPIVTEHTQGQLRPSPADPRFGLQVARRAAAHAGSGTPLAPGDEGYLAAHPPRYTALDAARFIDQLAGSPVEHINSLVTHPIRFVTPPAPRRDARGNLLPMDQQPVSAAAVWMPLSGGLRALKAASGALGKTAHAAEPAAADATAAGAAQVKAALRGAKSVRGKQEAGYSAERASRAAAADAIMRANPGIAGHHAALNALRGELPKINFGGFQELTPDALDALARHVHEHPHLMPFQKITAVSAIENAVAGKVPTNSEIRLLTNVFGKDTAAGLTRIHTLPNHLKSVVLEMLNVPRSLMASFDLSAPFRQGLMAGARHPVIFARNFKPMVQSFAKEGAYQAVQDEIRARPTFHMMEGAKLAVTDLSENLSNREENLFGYRMAERIPIVGHGVKGSGRAYNAFLTKMRADVFDHLVTGFQKQGINVHDEAFLKGLGRYINASTGRGDLGHFQAAAPYLNTVFFSPRLLASRLNFMNPVFYAKLPAPVRKEALRAALQLTGLVGTTLGLAGLAGARVGHDPRSADFAKIRLGNTRLDVLGGFQQPIRLLSQIASGKVISSTTGDALTLGPQGPGKLSRRDIVQRFFEGKLAPAPSLINDLFKGTDFQGKPFSWKQATVQRMIPLLAQDAAALYHDPVGGMNGIAAAVAGYGVGAFGVGVQTYGDSSASQASKVTAAWEKNRRLLGQKAWQPAVTAAIHAQAVRKGTLTRFPRTAQGRLAADLSAAVELGLLSQPQADGVKAKLATVPDSVINDKIRPQFTDAWFGGALLGPLQAAADRKAGK